METFRGTSIARNGDLESNALELFRRLANGLEKGRPSRVRVKITEQRLGDDVGESWIVVFHSFVEPVEGGIGLASIRHEVSDVVRRVALVLIDEFRFETICARRIAERVMCHGGAQQSQDVQGFSLHAGDSFVRVAAQQLRDTELVVATDSIRTET